MFFDPIHVAMYFVILTLVFVCLLGAIESARGRNMIEISLPQLRIQKHLQYAKNFITNIGYDVLTALPIFAQAVLVLAIMYSLGSLLMPANETFNRHWEIAIYYSGALGIVIFFVAFRLAKWIVVISKKVMEH